MIEARYCTDDEACTTFLGCGRALVVAKWGKGHPGVNVCKDVEKNMKKKWGNSCSEHDQHFWRVFRIFWYVYRLKKRWKK